MPFLPLIERNDMKLGRGILAAFGIAYVLIRHTQRVEAGAQFSTLHLLLFAALIVGGVWFTLTDPFGEKKKQD